MIFSKSKKKKITKRGSSKNESLYITVTHDVSLIMKYQQNQLILRALMIVLKKRKWLFRKSFLVLLLIISKICPWKINIQYLVLCKPGAQYFQRHFQHEFSCRNISKDSFGSVRSRSQMFFEICHLKNFANFARKYLYRSLFIIKLQTLD